MKHVKEGGAAYQAGLREGDRLVSAGGVDIRDKPYAHIIALIENR